MSHADDVRFYCRERYVEPARKTGQKTIEIRSGDVHAAMGYRNRYPLVCSAIGAKVFEDMCRIRRTAVEGPINGSKTVFRFEILKSIGSIP